MNTKLRQIWAVLTWRDAIVYRREELDEYLLKLLPTVSSFNDDPPKCNDCCMTGGYHRNNCAHTWIMAFLDRNPRTGALGGVGPGGWI